uniref:Uncharacterized protein n=1 Tax=Arundo donax TaxID=35708 RepID=A0A0A9B4G6_ARUDO
MLQEIHSGATIHFLDFTCSLHMLIDFSER